ncbi:MAG: PAS domain S-box protein [Candidatus Odinarchaeota archaeon]
MNVQGVSPKYLLDKIPVLLVDDEPELLQLSKIYLEKENKRFVVDTSTSATDALEKLGKSHYAVVISDYQMPVIDGLGFLKTLRNQGNDIPFIMFTGRGREEVAIDALNLGANRYIQKGGDPRAQYGYLAKAIIREVEHKQAGMDLRESEARQASILRVAPIGIGVVVDRVIIWASDTLASMTGYTRDELTNKNARELYPDEEEYKRVGFEKYAAIRKYGTGSIDTHWKCKDGSIIEIDLRSTPVDPDDLSKGVTFTALDITERKKMETIIRQERDSAQTYLDIAAVMIVALNAEGQITLINKRGCAILGHEEEELIGKNWFDVILPEKDRAEVKEVFQKIMAGELAPVEYYENPVLAKDGNERIIAWHNTSVVDEKGNIIGTLSSGEDITDRKRTEEDFRFQSSVLASVKDSIFVLDLDGNLVYANDAAWKTCGYTEEEFLAMPVFKLYPEKDLHLAKLQFETTLKEGTTFFETVHVKKDGTLIPVEINARLVDYAGKKVIVSAVRDISERKQVEAELRKSDARYRAVVRDQTELISRFLPDKTVTFVNDAYCRYFGKRREDIINKPFFDLVPENERDKVEIHIDSLTKKTPVATVEHHVYDASGKLKWFQWTDRAIFAASGALVEYQSVGRDITKQKLAEIALKESEERYRGLFEDSPVSLWEEDFSNVKKYLDALCDSGVVDFKEHFGNNPGEIIKCVDMVKVINVNKATLELYRARSKEELLENLETIFTERSFAAFKDEIIKIAEGNTRFGFEAINRTLTGKEITVELRWSVIPGHKNDLSRVLVSIIDVSERKIYQKHLEELVEKRTAELQELTRQLNQKLADLQQKDEIVSRERDTARKYLDIAGVIIVVLDTDQRVVMINKKGSEILGYPVSEITGKNWFNTFLPKRIRNDVKVVFEQLLTGNIEPFEYFENPVLTKSGEERIISWHNSIITDDKGKIVGTLTSGEDITERRKAEVKLQHRITMEELVVTISASFINILPDELDATICITLQKIGEFNHIDRSYVVLFSEDGKTMDNTYEWCAKGIEPQISILKELPADRFPSWIERLYRFETILIHSAANLSTEAGTEKEILQKQGIQSVIIVPMIHSNSLVGFIGFDSVREERVWLDEDISLLELVRNIITAAITRERSELLLGEFTKDRETEQLLLESKRRFQTLVSSMDDIVFTLDREHRHTGVFGRWLQNEGIGEEFFIGKTARDIFGVEKALVHEEANERALSGEYVLYDWSIEDPAGNRYMQTSLSPIYDSKGEVIGLVGIGRDITSLKQTEEKLQRATAAVESLNDSLRTINSILRHDLSNDLLALKGYLDLFYKDKDSIYIHKVSKIINKSASLISRMGELEHLILQGEALTPYDIKQAVTTVINNYQNNDVGFSVEGDGVVLADQALISVIDNIVRNALVHAETEKVAITIKDKKGVCEIHIADYGTGIPDKIKQRIFEPGFAHGETAGTGLGLYIAKKVIDRYGGEINVEDNAPKGSLFVIKLKQAEHV